jgi:hypothetical protein
VRDINPEQVIIETIRKLFNLHAEVLRENSAHLRCVIGLHWQPVHRFPPQRAQGPFFAVRSRNWLGRIRSHAPSSASSVHRQRSPPKDVIAWLNPMSYPLVRL